MYNMQDPEDVQRFKLNLMCSDIKDTITDHVNGKRIGVLPHHLEEQYVKFLLALRSLSDATAPKSVRP